jgi:hypothetical protein
MDLIRLLAGKPESLNAWMLKEGKTFQPPSLKPTKSITPN